MKIIKTFVILCTPILLFCANSCRNLTEDENCHRWIRFSNNSEKDIYYSFNIFDEIPEYNPGSSPIEWRIEKNEYIKLANTRYCECFESVAEEGKGKIYLFLFDSEMVEKSNWGSGRENNIYLKKYALTIEELNEMDWKLVYSGD